jgi:secreted PhoX family phosphatase
MPVSIQALIVGEDLATPTTFGDTAAVDNMANPDNLKFSETARTLFIGEDCSQHVTCTGWAFNVDTSVLTRTLTAPSGAELTGLGAYDNING